MSKAPYVAIDHVDSDDDSDTSSDVADPVAATSLCSLRSIINGTTLSLKYLTAIWKLLYVAVDVIWTLTAPTSPTLAQPNVDLDNDDYLSQPRERPSPPFKLSGLACYYLMHFLGAQAFAVLSTLHIAVMQHTQAAGTSLAAARIFQFLFEHVSFICLGGLAGQYINTIHGYATGYAVWHGIFFFAAYMCFAALGIQVSRHAFEWQDESALKASKYSAQSFWMLKTASAMSIYVMGLCLWVLIYAIVAYFGTAFGCCMCLQDGGAGLAMFCLVIFYGPKLALEIIERMPKRPDVYALLGLTFTVLGFIMSIVNIVRLTHLTKFDSGEVLAALINLSRVDAFESATTRYVLLAAQLLFLTINLGLFIAKIIYRGCTCADPELFFHSRKIRQLLALTSDYSAMLKHAFDLALLRLLLHYVHEAVAGHADSDEERAQLDEKIQELQAKLQTVQRELDEAMDRVLKQIYKLRRYLY
eukprot:TRINITY_DN10550_c0_g1_i2.p1 TRINITY_DN10550_c0_g1~~TRINITY_DN10550_c0_g1_i2.p1  ORF type:complete len:472 (+),score=93.98 TRINITY_DN10550_c0_g1_i2:129-1544(+)